MPLSQDEVARLAALRSLDLRGQGPEERFDALTRLAVEVFSVPIAYIAMIEEKEQWFKSQVGLGECRTSREVAFCHYTIQQDDTLVVEDARTDARFADNPLVTGPKQVRFYAGHPVRAPGGEKVGTLCLMSCQPRPFSEKDRTILRRLATMVERELGLMSVIDLQDRLLETQARLVESERRLRDELEQAARYVEGLLPGKVADGPLGLDWFYQPSVQLGGDAFGIRWIDDRRAAVFVLDVCGHGVSAALLSISALNILRVAPLDRFPFTDPVGALERLNTGFPMEANDLKYFTIWYGVIDLGARTLRYSSAGHPPALLMRPGEDGALEELATRAMPIGWLPRGRFTEATTAFPSGAALLLYTDGVYEFKGPGGDWFTFDRFKEVARSCGLEVDPMMEVLRRERQGTEFDDDVALFRVFGSGG
ncbi:MAG: GAF domain-containing SpoIIE family protein phosphatase [Verrucomicrobiia bacterium]